MLQAAVSEAGSGSWLNKQTACSGGREASGIDPLPLLPPSVSDNGIDWEALDALFPWPPRLCISSHQASFSVHHVSDVAAVTVTRQSGVEAHFESPSGLNRIEGLSAWIYTVCPNI